MLHYYYNECCSRTTIAFHIFLSCIAVSSSSSSRPRDVICLNVGQGDHWLFLIDNLYWNMTLHRPVSRGFRGLNETPLFFTPKIFFLKLKESILRNWEGNALFITSLTSEEGYNATDKSLKNKLNYTLSHPEKDCDVSAYSIQRRLSSRAQLVCFLKRSKRNTEIDA